MVINNTIPDVLATLILKPNVPQEAIALAGESIAVAARLADYKQGASRRTTFEKWTALAEGYEVQLQRARSATTDFSQAGDGLALIKALSEIKQGLIAL